MHEIKEVSVCKIKTIAVPSDIKESVKNTLWQYVLLARKKFGKQFAAPTISFDLRGKTAGKAFLGKNHVQLNAVLLLENFDEFLADTVPHELAHLITHALYKKASAHGPEWKAVMRLLGVNPDRCHSYDVTNSATRKTLPYRCGCPGRTIELSITQHNRIKRGVKYMCNTCKVVLTPGAGIQAPREFTDLPSVRTPTPTPAVNSTASGAVQPPTEKQLAYARFLASKRQTTIPLGALVCKTQMSRWISAQTS